MKSSNQSIGLSAPEQEMFKEISTVFAKYADKAREFGLCLLHSHFNMQPNEILHETNDKERRMMFTSPILKENIPTGAHPTAWSISPHNGNPTILQLCCD